MFSKKAMNKQGKEKGLHREQEKREKRLAFLFSPLSHAYFFIEAVALNVPKKTPTSKKEKTNVSKSPNNFPAQVKRFEIRFLRPTSALCMQLFCLADLICLKPQC